MYLLKNPYRSKLSAELNILIESLRHSFIPEAVVMPPDDLARHNTKKLRSAVNLHRVKPLLLELNQKNNFLDADFRKALELNQLTQVAGNLKSIHEAQIILESLDEFNIPCMLLKGSLFINTIYRNRQLREVRDIDILCKGEHVLSVVRMLQSRGFIVKVGTRTIEQQHLEGIFELLLKSGHFNEVTLIKNGINVDLHWRLYKSYLGYNYESEQLLDNTFKGDFYGKEVRLPVPTDLFWMLLIHHGGNENWSKFKFLADLMAFLNTYEKEIDWETVLKDAENYCILNKLLHGFWLLKHVIGFPVPKAVSDRLKNESFTGFRLVIKTWEQENSVSDENINLKHRIRYLTRDKSISSLMYLKNYMGFFWMRNKIKHYPRKFGLASFLYLAYENARKLILSR